MTNESLYLLHFLSTIRFFALYGVIGGFATAFFAFITAYDGFLLDCKAERVRRIVFIAGCVAMGLSLLAILVIPDYLTLEKMLVQSLSLNGGKE